MSKADEISWALDGTGVLLISAYYEDGEDVSPWFYEDYHTVIISDGITSIGDYAFKDAENLTTIVLTTSVTNISWNAFENCDAPIAMYIIGYEYQFEPVIDNSYPSNFTFYYRS